MGDRNGTRRLLRILALGSALTLLGLFAFVSLVRFADGPIAVFPGGPFRSGERVDYSDLNWDSLASLRELELELGAGGGSRLLWFSVHEGRPYLSCGVGCADEWIKRWPHYVEQDDRVVLRVDGKLVDARLERVAHDSAEYRVVRAGRERKYAGTEGGRPAAESSAHSVVIELGGRVTEAPTPEAPQDRLYRVVPR